MKLTMLPPTRRLVLLLTLAACAGEQPERAPPSSVNATDAASNAAAANTSAADAPFTLSCDGLSSTVLGGEPTRAGFRSAFGEPRSVIAATEPNRHIQGATDSLFVIRYSGLTASFRTPTAARDLISAVTIRDNRFVADSRVGIGASEEDVIRLLGEPTRRADEALVYDCGEGAEQPVFFDLADGRVVAIRVEYYVD